MIRQNNGDSTPSPTTSLHSADHTAVRPLPASTTATTWRRQSNPISAASTTAQATIDAILASEPRPVRSIQTPLGGPQTLSSSSRNGGANTPESGDKVYCTHWIRHGECDYIQQGCRYKHKMPNKATLQSIGFRAVPRWWQEKVAVQLGQSAIPIVGAGLKPSEWMKLKKRASDSGESSSGDSDSESDSGSDESETGSDAGVDEGEDKAENEEKPQSQVNTVEMLTPATNPVVDQPAKTVTLQPPTKTTEASQTTVTPQTMQNTSAKTIRKPSLTGSDLIDFSPTDSACETFATFRSACPSSCASTTTTNEPKLQEGKSNPTIAAPAPGITQNEKKQYPTPSPTPSPPRKIFVPAGESKEYHIAQARRKNAAVPPTEVPAVKFTLGGGHAKEATATKQTKYHKQQVRNPSTAKKRPTDLADLSSGGKGGLMASVHAPNNTPNPASTPTPAPTAASPILSPTTVKQQQHRRHLLQQAKHAKKSEKSGQYGSRSVSSSSALSPPSSPSPGTNTLKTPEVEVVTAKSLEKTKPASKGSRPAIPDACRPRRPAGQAGKDSRPSVKKIVAKVAKGTAKVVD